MADLEKLQGPPEVILEEAAKILGLNLERTSARCSAEFVYKDTPRSHGFKEQWVLRWLLKKLGVSDSKSKTGPEQARDSRRRYGIHMLTVALILTNFVPDSSCVQSSGRYFST